MSDDEDFMMSADEDDYNFDYEEDDDEEMAEGNEGEELDLENKYYNAKALKEDEPNEALEIFLSGINEDKDSEWSFKCIKQAIKLSYIVHKDKKEILDLFKILIERTDKPVITKNYAETSLNNIIEWISCDDLVFMKNIYTIALDELKKKNDNSRLWVRMSLKLVNLYISNGMVDEANDLVKELIIVCGGESGSGGGSSVSYNIAGANDNIMSTYLLEVYALEIQLCTITGNIKRLKELYNKTINVSSAILHPKILGVIRECGGKMHMQEKKWDSAREDFFESFKNYDEAGSLNRIQVLKYYVLACMLSESGINPFESQETKPYKDHPKVSIIVELVDIFQKSDIERFNKLMRSHKAEIESDSFFASFLDDIILSIRSLAILNLVKPYKCISLTHLEMILSVDELTLVEIITGLILDNRLINSKIDLTNKYLDLDIKENKSKSTDGKSKSTSTTTSATILPNRYYQSELDQKQIQEQKNLVKSSTEAVAAMSTNTINPTSSDLSATRETALLEWVQSTRNLHKTIHVS